MLIEDARSTTGCILESTGTNTDRYSTVLNGESQAYSLPLSRVCQCITNKYVLYACTVAIYTAMLMCTAGNYKDS